MTELSCIKSFGGVGGNANIGCPKDELPWLTCAGEETDTELRCVWGKGGHQTDGGVATEQP